MNGFSGGAHPSPFDYKESVAQIKKKKKLYISGANGLKFILNHAALKTYYVASYQLHVKEERLKLGIQKVVV